ncbi:hypothetical protein D3C73_451350 [compost metagenome]
MKRQGTDSRPDGIGRSPGVPDLASAPGTGLEAEARESLADMQRQLLHSRMVMIGRLLARKLKQLD